MLWLEYHPQVKSYACGDIGQAFATAYRLPLKRARQNTWRKMPSHQRSLSTEDWLGNQHSHTLHSG